MARLLKLVPVAPSPPAHAFRLSAREGRKRRLAMQRPRFGVEKARRAPAEEVQPRSSHAPALDPGIQLLGTKEKASVRRAVHGDLTALHQGTNRVLSRIEVVDGRLDAQPLPWLMRTTLLCERCAHDLLRAVKQRPEKLSKMASDIRPIRLSRGD
jgi:hypothetical protein